ncbi:hypothetical protein TNCV_4488261 [Trichonephila clavipes]|nr:hypothetical protein TNCV_4488261 [Trichonephila clavipes]
MPQDTSCRRRLDLTEESKQLKIALDSVVNCINEYKEHGVEPHSFLIQNQLQLQAVYEKDMQHVVKEGFDRKGATQCFKCNQFNHTAHNYHLTPRCLKCGKDHQTRECQIVKVDSLFCINCQTYCHLANYSKCPFTLSPAKAQI